jgi:Mg/Co/Ni transporter MgtE
MKQKLVIDMRRLDRQDNIKFFRMLDAGRWAKLVETFKDASNIKTIEELVTELVESGN